ncbi:diaminopimelate decarboxylase [Enhydrobacter sp.]|jgi:diaminopimelate decarboxylase|uniref:diaminopimelate decarboxylase n=1 Tax=Enhydrobacter sp. TaxID=1894999 RepID=UPI002624E3A8|nr:diaminopimelate decarboxylase [Enhydrobacter sp.]WIM14327.1 MAG: Diaminopimelate decarboxylase [Enhydrobacter sp.]
MNFFEYRDGEMHAEGVALRTIARQVGTPFYCYSAGALRAAFREFADGMKGLNASVCYALKANSNLAVIKIFGDLGAGADIVSVGEMHRALAAGIPARRIVYSGVGKKAGELAAALQAGVGQINVESVAELETLNAVAGQLGVKADITIRVNPDIDAGTHEKITTGRKENKFGIDIDLARDAFAKAARLSNLRVVGVAMHIGSQLTTLEPYRAAIARVRALIGQLRADGHRIDRFDVGGGLGIVYADEQPPAISAFMQVVGKETAGLGCELTFEPGRRLVGEAGVLVSEVILVKPGVSRTFVIVDAAMNDLIRPTLYEAWHDILPVRRPRPDAATIRCDIVGPICESGDYLAQNRDLPPLSAGDLVMVRSAGAYGAVMASSYNSRPLAPEVMVEGTRFAVTRPRPTIEEMISAERLPPWMES